MHAPVPVGLPETGSRRTRVSCKLCARSIEMVRLREHLRAEHQLDTASVEARYQAAQRDVRRTQRSRA